MTRLLTLSLLVAGILPSCATPTLVHVIGPKGTQVSINGSEPEFVPFQTRVRGRRKVEVILHKEVLETLGLSNSQIQTALKSKSLVLDGILDVKSSPDEYAELKLEDEYIRRTMLGNASTRFTWSWQDSRKRTILTFLAKARIKR